ncbi:MAG: ABC transporter permease, partial [Candidatus Angelobacter sp.]
MASRIQSWWKALARRSRMEDEMEAELCAHIENYADDLVRGGMEREEARRNARAELGSLAAQKEECRASLGLRPWDDLRADMSYALRQLRNSPGFTATVLLVLMLGIGANAAMFSVIDATLLRRLPFPRAGELVTLVATDAKNTSFGTFYADILEWQRQSHTLEQIAYYNAHDEIYLQSGSGAQPVSASHVSANVFAALGVAPSLGRGFRAEEQKPGKGTVVVLSDPLWQNVFHSDPAILGKRIQLNDAPYTVIGVMPAQFMFPADDKESQVWIP